MVCFNGKFFPDNQPLLTPGNHAFKWGQGVFETIRMHAGTIPLWTLHSARLQQSLQLLNWPAVPDLHHSVLELCQLNGLSENARIRIEVFPSGSGSSDFLIEALPLSPDPSVNSGRSIGICPDIIRPSGKYASLKSTSYQNFLLAAQYAHHNGWYDAVILNDKGNICETSRANIYVLKNGNIKTPALTEACIDGVARRHILNTISVEETAITIADLNDANEVFISNALIGLQPISSFGQKNYAVTATERIYETVFSTIFR